MTCSAVLIGNSEYKNLQNLECCRADLRAMEQLLKATEKYQEVIIIENETADALKASLRTAVDKIKAPTELFFYFTGHGFQHETDFFYCATNFSSTKPNETGLSTSDLHALLRLSDAEVVIKVVDACDSGTLLVKSEGGGPVTQTKGPFKNLIQIASCLESQNSLTGDPLSLFTDRFISAALRKTEGAVYYLDIISSLRDDFIDNDKQTPFFVSQYTGREQFVDDAAHLNKLREILTTRQKEKEEKTNAINMTTKPLSLLERLKAADNKVVNQDLLSSTVGSFFDALIQKINKNNFSDYFTIDITEHARFEESTTERFIIAVLSKEARPDNFVTATHERRMRRRNSLATTAFRETYIDEDPFVDEWDLRLNCTMARAQLRFTFTPKFANLDRIVLVVSCAPSLDICYIFEMATRHVLKDFGKFNSGGPDASRRWWKLPWRDSSEHIASQISDKIQDIVRLQLESVEERLSKKS